MRLNHALQKFQQQLLNAGVDNPSLDVRLLTAYALGCDRVTLIANPDRELSDVEFDHIVTLINRRAKREPVARILGQREFWGLPFAMNEATLEPRPDSETLVTAVLEKTKAQTALRILDLGTGTGCLLLSLLYARPKATGIGIDKSARAIEQATTNAKQLELMDRVSLQTGDWLETVVGHFDIIISNPPYIPSCDVKGLEPEVHDFDPLLALDGGQDGLDPYRRIIPRLLDFLTADGFAAFEVGIGQSADVVALLHSHGLTHTSLTKDLGDVERVVIAQR